MSNSIKMIVIEHTLQSFFWGCVALQQEERAFGDFEGCAQGSQTLAYQ